MALSDQPRKRAPRAPSRSATPADARETYSIGDLAAEFKITTRAIRFYEHRGLLAPARRGVTRTYSMRDRARLNLILRGKNLGFSLEDIAEFLALYDADPSQLAQTRLLLAKVADNISELQIGRAHV